MANRPAASAANEAEFCAIRTLRPKGEKCIAMKIDHGTGVDPWTLGRPLSEEPEIHPTSVVRASDFGRFTYLGPRSHVANSVIGDYGYAMGDNQIAHAQIGKFVNIATSVRINPPNHPTWRAKDLVEIGHDVWLGHGAIVMPGVKIGDGAAIGSGAVVTRDVPPYAIAVGVPARVLRPRFDAETVERLQRIAWWQWSPEQIDAAMGDFRELDAEAFAKKYDR